MVTKEEILLCIDKVYDYGKMLISMWSDLSMQQIRLETANLRKIELLRQAGMKEMDENKARRYKLQK